MGEAAQLAPARLCALRELEHHVQHTETGQAAFGAFGAVTDGREGALDWIGGADALPVLGREVEKGEQLFAVLDQAGGGLGVFRLIGLDEQIEGGLGVCVRFSLPDVVQHFGCRSVCAQVA